MRQPWFTKVGSAVNQGQHPVKPTAKVQTDIAKTNNHLISNTIYAYPVHNRAVSEPYLL